MYLDLALGRLCANFQCEVCSQDLGKYIQRATCRLVAIVTVSVYLKMTTATWARGVCD